MSLKMQNLCQLKMQRCGSDAQQDMHAVPLRKQFLQNDKNKLTAPSALPGALTHNY